MMVKPQYFRNGNEIAVGADNPNVLFIERGNAGLAIINKSKGTFDVKAAKMPGLQTGGYWEQHYNFNVSIGTGIDRQKYVTQWGTSRRGGLQIGGRDALFLVQTSPHLCWTLSRVRC